MPPIEQIGAVVASALAVFSAIANKYLELRTRQLQSQLDFEKREREIYEARLKELERFVSDYRERVESLEESLRERDTQYKELSLKYDILRHEHNVLLHQYKATEDSNMKLKEELMRHYADGDATGVRKGSR